MYGSKESGWVVVAALGDGEKEDVEKEKKCTQKIKLFFLYTLWRKRGACKNGQVRSLPALRTTETRILIDLTPSLDCVFFFFFKKKSSEKLVPKFDKNSKNNGRNWSIFLFRDLALHATTTGKIIQRERSGRDAGLWQHVPAAESVANQDDKLTASMEAEPLLHLFWEIFAFG